MEDGDKPVKSKPDKIEQMAKARMSRWPVGVCCRCLDTTGLKTIIRITHVRLTKAKKQPTAYNHRLVESSMLLCKSCLKELDTQFNDFMEMFLKQGDEEDS